MIVDLPLVRRVEGTAARWAARQVDALCQTLADDTPCRQELDGGLLAAMGPGRYVNRGVGLGLGDLPAAALLDQVEAFFTGRGLPPALELTPWASAELVAELRSRGYGVEWFRNVYAHQLDRLPPKARTVAIEEVGDDDDEAEWTAILGAEAEPGSEARARSDEFCRAMHRVPGSIDLLARADGRAIGCGSLTVVHGVGWLGGAATLPQQRGRGAQLALVVERLHRARRDGCTFAAVTALPGGSSARNLERLGFQLLYTQPVFSRARTG